VTSIVQAVDVNGDGQLDLVALTDTGIVRVLLGDGDGHFAQSAAVVAIGIRTARASAAFTRAEALYASGEYVKAYAWYSSAYQALR
jgi:hypothetical protein